MNKSSSKSLDSYEKLAKTLNTIPNGFSILADGTHLKVLQIIFEPEEAELASKMKLTTETVKKMSRRLKIPEDELAVMLATMKKKGQIRTENSKKGKKYGLLPFAVGIYEEQLHRMDAKLVQTVEEYFKKSNGTILFKHSPTLHRIIPVNRVIKAELEIHPYYNAEKMIREARSWGVRGCTCRKHSSFLGKPCTYSPNVCLAFSPEKNAYVDDNSITHISLNEALEILNDAEEAGLIHSTMNVKHGQFYICNCCTCCCGPIRALTEFKQPYAIVKSDFEMSVNQKLCTGCG
ncbi:MAG: hypothetical protein ACXABK_04410, partial [Candidatus Heimdallarchaeaceae archaeon]